MDEEEMSGGEISYSLRPNKFVERQLFVELLTKLCSGNHPTGYVYVSLGGPQLEDQRLIHCQLGIKKLFSIESDPIVHKRQVFNLRPSYIQCRNEKTGDFVSKFANFADSHSDKQFIIWFDYASARERREQLIEYQTLLGELQNGDILKITMNANPSTLGEKRSGDSEEDVLERRLDALKKQLDSFLPVSPLTPDQMIKRNFAPILCNAIKIASLNAIQYRPRIQIIPIAIFLYQDGPHQMLTVTVHITEKTGVKDFRDKITSSGWEYFPSEWDDITKINVPHLTAKERLYIEEFLFSKETKSVHNEMPFRFHSDEKKSLEILEEYAKHYGRYPSYFQVIL